MSLKIRLLGSFGILLALFALEVPLVYWAVSGNGAGPGASAVFAVIFLGVCLAAVFMLLAGKHILAPVRDIQKTINGLSAGNFRSRSTVKVSVLGIEMNDEFKELSGSVNSMAEKVSRLIEKIEETSTHLASASEELSATSAHISEGAMRQSGQTSYAATAMDEMNATVLEVAKNSHQASIDAKKASETASRGGQVVNGAISAMQDVAEATSVSAATIQKLGSRSEEIGTIVSVINDIADQTNLLALNAAIEAARAGEQGRGFAVVADEVRKLAERTTRATREIGGMITSIQGETSKAVSAMKEGTLKVENGVRLANEAGQALNDIVSGVELVTDMIAQIATSAEEQSATTDEIARSVESIAEVSKESVFATGEVAKATSELAALAAELGSLVSGFKAQDKDEETGPEMAVHKRLRLVHPLRKTMPAYTSEA
ncbi:MAG: hypothetical protein K8I01_06680 [Candidatus Methylomirabilis sp.]|nr:hypothetical protein [Deltaproteobacteria bacterium]